MEEGSSLQKRLVLEPIGWVRNSIATSQKVLWEEIESQVVIEERFAEALEGLEEFSHIIVLFWLHQKKEGPPPLKIRPEMREDMPLVGVLATRAPVRPNPIGLTVVELLERRGNTLSVRGLDAYDGTPVLDIKPYLPRGDLVEKARVAPWVKRLLGEPLTPRGDKKWPPFTIASQARTPFQCGASPSLLHKALVSHLNHVIMLKRGRRGL